MPTYKARFVVPAEIVVLVVADDEEIAGDLAWEEANQYADTVLGDHLNVGASWSLNGIGAEEVFEVES